MSLTNLGQLELLYEGIQARYPVEAGSSSLADAVHFGTNRLRPIHRWFHFKEGFSAELFEALGLDTTSLRDPSSVFLDPFCGSGTTLLAGDLESEWRALRVGVEINPFVAFVASTKVLWRDYCPVRFSKLVTSLLSEPLAEDFSSARRPALSTFKNPEIFEPERLSALLDMVQRLDQIDAPERAPLLLGIASTAERVGFYRKDGRALRILRSPSELRDRRDVTVTEALRRSWAVMFEDLEVAGLKHPIDQTGPGVVMIGDGRVIALPEELGVGRGDVSLMAYSPPYLNHIDYTEVYKVELWLLGFVHTQEEMLSLRKQTLRSHASIGITPAAPNLPSRVEQALLLASSSICSSEKKWHRTFAKLALAYLEDMYRSLKRQFELLRPGGRAVCVVANSAHGANQQRVPVAVDLFIAELAEAVGFDVEQFVVARQLVRRDHLNRFLRETALVLRRPAAS